MFDYTHDLDEFPVCIGNAVVMSVTGRAFLENDPDYSGGSYGFIVKAIELEGHLFGGDWRDTRYVTITEKSDDEFDRLLFQKLSEALRKDDYTNECFASELADHMAEAV